MTAMENESSDGNVSPKKKSIRKGKTALARVLLLDGSYLDIQIDVNIFIVNDLRILYFIYNIFNILIHFCII
jgi:hypothetical protein